MWWTERVAAERAESEAVLTGAWVISGVERAVGGSGSK